MLVPYLASPIHIVFLLQIMCSYIERSRVTQAVLKFSASYATRINYRHKIVYVSPRTRHQLDYTLKKPTAEVATKLCFGKISLVVV
jgi:hypothetical protein